MSLLLHGELTTLEVEFAGKESCRQSIREFGYSKPKNLRHQDRGSEPPSEAGVSSGGVSDDP